MVLFCKDNKFNGTHQQAVSLTPLLSTVLFIRRVMLLPQKLLICWLSKTIIFFCFNNKLNEWNKSDCCNQWTPAFTKWNEFSTDMRRVAAVRFVPFAERLRSLSCWVDLCNLLNLLLTPFSERTVSVRAIPLLSLFCLLFFCIGASRISTDVVHVIPLPLWHFR